jgi:hypothetical protein
MSLRAVAGLLGLVVSLRAPASLQPPVLAPETGLVHTPALVTASNPNPSGVIFYTVDGSDPRERFGNVARNARVYKPGRDFPAIFPLSVNRSMVVRARVKAGAEWSDAVAAAFTADQDFSNLLFTEISYHGPPGPIIQGVGELIELKNVGVVALDVSGLELRNLYRPEASGNLLHLFPVGTIIGPGQFYLLVENTNAFPLAYPGVQVDGQLLRKIDHERGELVVRATNGAIAMQAQFYSHAPWPVVPDDHGYFAGEMGFTLVRTNYDTSLDPRDYRTWQPSAARFGSPGADDPPILRPPIYVTEILTRTSGGLQDSVELFNPNATPVDLSGWWLSDMRNWPYRYRIPANTVISALGYRVFTEADFNVGPSSNAFSFSADGERCYIFSGDTNGNLTGYSHGFQFDGSDRDVSFGRQAPSTGADYLLPLSARSFGSSNGPPAQPPLIISEFLYAPDVPNGFFLELHNMLNVPLLLNDPEQPMNRWALGYSPWQDFEPSIFFPTNTLIPAKGYLLLVSGDTNAFRTNYDVPNDIVILGPSPFPTNFYFLSPDTPDGGKALRLYKPSGTASSGGTRYVVIDEVYYQNHFPWDPGASGGGSSLERLGDSPFGNDPANWRASLPGGSPGRDNRANLPPQVWAGGNKTDFPGRGVTVSGEIFDDGWPGTTLTSTWTQVSGPAAVTFRSNTLTSTTVTFVQTGEYVLRLSVTDGASTNSDQATVHIVSPPFDSWRSTSFTSAELLDESISGPAADPDHDGLSNLQEYFFVRLPKLYDGTPAWHVRVVNDHLQLVWTQRTDAPDVTVIVERANTIQGPWFGGEGLLEQLTAPGSAPGTLESTWQIRLPTVPATMQFIRVRLSRL